MGRKKFTKENSQKFHLLHRSATDMAHVSDENPSPLVLVPAETNLNERKRVVKRGDGDSISLYSDRMGSVASARSRKNQDHINEFGFVNDGYDYSKHFRDADGGVVYGANALSQTLLRAKHIELPEEVFAQGDLDPSILQNAITIADDCMDEDLRAALFEDADDDGVFEELDDDFVAQAMAEPTTQDFDFEAHIAKLLNKSAATLGINGKSKRGGKLSALEEGDEEDGEYFDEDDMSWPSDEDDEDFDDHPRRPQQGLISDAHFEQILREYEDDDDDDEDGEYYEDEVDEDDEGEDHAHIEREGAIDIFATEGVDVTQGRRGQFEAALDEFIQEKKAGEMIAPLPKVIRSFETYVKESEALGPVDVQAAAKEQAELQQRWAEEVKELDRMAEESAKEIPICQEYLRQEKVVEQWDCESILSTLSTTDNLPTVLSDNRYLTAKQRKHLQNVKAGNTTSNNSVYSRASTHSHRQNHHNKPFQTPPVSVSQLLNNRPAPLTGKIVLSGRLNLPEGFTPKDIRQQQQQQENQSVVSKLHHILQDSSSATENSKMKLTKGKKVEKSQLSKVIEEDEKSEEEEDDESEEEEDGSEEEDEEVASNVRRRGRESAEERKLRKQQVKEARRHKRASKKQMKESFAAEQVKIVKALGRETAATEHVSVFRYTG